MFNFIISIISVKLNAFLFLLLFRQIKQTRIYNPPTPKRIYYPLVKMSIELSFEPRAEEEQPQIVTLAEAPVKAPRKKRSAEEIALEKAEKEQKKIQREEKRVESAKKAEEVAQKRQLIALKKEQYSSPLIPGTGTFAQSAMHVIDLCKQNMSRTNTAFRQMFASRQIFPPKKNINKFATGGIAEECATQLFCDIGLKCENMSEESTVIDLEIKVPIDEQIVSLQVSMKNSGRIASPPILENYRGQKRQEIRPLPPTFIIYTETEARRARIVYLDEEIVRQGYPGLSDEEFNAEIYANNDSNLTFKSGFLAKFIPRLPAEYIVDAEFPEDITGLTERNFSKIALEEVIRQLSIAK